MLKILKGCKATYLLIAVWIVLFVLSGPFSLVPRFAGRGIDVVGQEYYRLLTGPLLHYNLIHLIGNIIGIYFAGRFAEPSIGSLRFFALGLIASTLSELLYSCIFPVSDNHIGGSTWVFCFIGLIIALQLFNPDFPRLRRGTLCGDWILGYAILGNVPFMSFMDVGTVVTHLCALAAGGILGAIGIWVRLW